MLCYSIVYYVIIIPRGLNIRIMSIIFLYNYSIICLQLFYNLPYIMSMIILLARGVSGSVADIKKTTANLRTKILSLYALV